MLRPELNHQTALIAAAMSPSFTKVPDGIRFF
jgi:hypothetical protein